MLRSVRLALAAASAALLTLAPNIAAAQDPVLEPRNYVFLGGGVGFGGDLDAEDVSEPGDFFDNFDEIADLDDDDGADLGVGWQVFGGLGAENVIIPGLRLELEGLFTNNDLEEFDDLEQRVVAGFGNALYQFKIWRIEPYVGAGVGFGRTKVQLDPEDEIGFQDQPDISDGGLAWQLKAGLAFPLRDNLTLDVGYRYLNGPNVDDAATFDPLTQITTFAELDPEIHSVNASLRFAFGGGPRWGRRDRY